jgi:hypothetical protein
VRSGDSTSTNPAIHTDAATHEDMGMLTRSPSDDPALDRTEAMLRRLQGSSTSAQAAGLVADELPDLVGVDWAAFFTAEPAGGRNAADRPHQTLIAAALANGCVYSYGEPPTVAAVPVHSAGAPAGVILLGRAAGLCVPQLRTAALFAQHAGALTPSVPLAKTA